MSHPFECRREIEVEASPEQAWAAVATAAGNAAWLFPNEIDPRAASTTVWEPPSHFASRVEQGEWFNAIEFEIEGVDGGRSRVRYAHSGIFVESWEQQLDSVQQHTDFYLHTLGEYLRHFRGRAATYVGEAPAGIQGPPSSSAPDGFARLRRALSLPAELSEGEEVTLRPAGMEPIGGVVDYARESFLGVRGSDAMFRFFGRNAFGAPVGMSIHAFAPLDAAQERARWQSWIDAALA